MQAKQKREHIQRHAVGERIDMVEQELVTGSFRAGRLYLRHPICQKINRLIKRRTIAGAIGVA